MMARRKIPVPRVLKKALAPIATPVASGASRVKLQLERRAAHSAGLSLLYSTLDGRFGIEARRLLAGLALHDQVEGAPDSSGAKYTLRRNTHRLEKGLAMRPIRHIFALGYIAETIDALEVSAAAYHADQHELFQWACDVLSVYFDICDSHPLIETQNKRFLEITSELPWRRGDSVPYARRTPENLPSYEQLAALAKRRRSVRWFKQERVPRELIDRALLVGFQAPSACNRQPFRFAILDDPDLVKAVSTIPLGTVGFAENIPTLIVVLGQLRAFHHPRDRHLIYIDSCLAVMGFELALETLGLSSCSINWPSIPDKEREMELVLRLAPDECPVMLIAVGFPDDDGKVPFSQKRPLSELRQFNL